MSIWAAGPSGEALNTDENPRCVLSGRLGSLELGFWVLLSRRKRCYCFICERKGWCENYMTKGSENWGAVKGSKFVHHWNRRHFYAHVGRSTVAEGPWSKQFEHSVLVGDSG